MTLLRKTGPGAVSVILFFRCAVGVLYSLLVRMTPQHPEERQATQQVNDLQERFNQQLQHLAQEMTSLQENVQTSLTANSSELAMTLQTSLTASTSEFAMTFQGHLATELAALQAHIQRIEQATREDLRQVKTALDKQAQKTVDEPHRQTECPVLLSLPFVQKAKFDARAFVFSCLQQDSTCKLADIEKLAEAQGQEISQSSISRYRTQFFASSESSAMQA